MGETLAPVTDSAVGVCKAGGMEAALFITICLMTVIAAITAGLFARHRNPKSLVAGIGLVLIPLGLYLTGLMRLIYNGVLSIIDWAQRTVWDDTMSWGAGLLGAGVVLLVIAGFIKSRPRPRQAQTATPSAEPKVTGRPAQQQAVTTGKPQPAASATAAKPTAKGGKDSALDPEDAEIEALLRKRGIM
ncbi:hypothetical protein LKO27_07260 [Tessaracoccus sp. OS52]|uniref:hypothetical protein n=1 Tax=Tessaracoccus sp. OS52 TaxID=2886691 RepID=UPI001D12DA75|nr:hypothetical protein [Tessaracoccus sp. OS52]MCC2593205.1 hypothetical protein [Tessaracoccus sp. OS52]